VKKGINLSHTFENVHQSEEKKAQQSPEKTEGPAK
jgi:hypothetical protein